MNSDNCIQLAFEGPFSWPGSTDAPSIFDVEVRSKPGVYLWTVPLSEGHLIYYVGETGRDFRTRMAEHYTEHAAAMYHVYDPAGFARGEKILLWPGRYDPENPKSEKECILMYSELSGAIRKLTAMYRFFLAPTACDRRLRNRMEAAIAQTLYDTPGIVGSFQDRGIRYHNRKEGEQPIECHITAPVMLMGLPEILQV
ncbi:hypothetical protein JXA40_11690 [bacterium]|nr:hypothetical protein [candidate division CSSED10-310 bacterium]